MGDQISNIPKRFVIVQSTAPSSPFEGQVWVDTSSGNTTKQYKNGSWVKIGSDLDSVRATLLTLVSDVSRNRYDLNRSIENFDDVMFDVFVNQDKISSTSKINVSSGFNGNIELNRADGDIDTLESGSSDLGWESNGNVSIDTNSEVKGSNSVELDGSAGNVENNLPNDLNDDGDVFKLSVKPTNLSSGTGHFHLKLEDDNAYNRVLIENPGDGSGDIRDEENNQTLATGVLNDGEVTDLKCVFDFTNSTYDFYVDGDLKQSNIGWQSGGNSFVRLVRLSDGNNSSKVYYDNITSDAVNGGGFGSYDSSGTLTSTTQSQDFTPSKILVNQDANIPTDTDISYTIKDGSGNSKTVSQSEIGEELSVSFEDSNITVEVNPSTNNTDKSPTLNEYGVMFV